jgi:uncharacterized membrane protein
MLLVYRLPLAAGFGLAATTSIVLLTMPSSRETTQSPVAPRSTRPAPVPNPAYQPEAETAFPVNNVGYTSKLQTSLYVEAPLEFTFEFLANFENLSDCIPDVRQVHDLGPSRTRWTVAGPAGILTQWDVQIVQSIRNRSLSWKNGRTSLAAHEGRLRFRSIPNQGTQIDVTIVYANPAGTWGTKAATIFGADLESDLRAVLFRIKLSIEMQHRMDLVLRGTPTS